MEKSQRGRTFQHSAGILHTGRLQSAAGQSILGDGVGHVLASQLAAQLRQFGHGETAIVAENHRLGTSQRLCQLGGLHRFLGAQCHEVLLSA